MMITIIIVIVNHNGYDHDNCVNDYNDKHFVDGMGLVFDNRL